MPQVTPWVRNILWTICIIVLLSTLLWRESLVALICGRPLLFVLGCWQIIESLLILRRRYLIKQYGVTTTGQLKELKSHGRWTRAIVEFTPQNNKPMVVEVQQSVNFLVTRQFEGIGQ